MNSKEAIPNTPMSHADLVMTSTVAFAPIRRSLTQNIIANGKQFAPSADWNAILDCVTENTIEGRPIQGESLISKYFTPKLASIAFRMGWGMDTPEVVYISGFYFTNYLAERLNKLQFQLAGGMTFQTDAQKEKILEGKRNEAFKIDGLKIELDGGLSEFANAHLADKDPLYLKVYQRLSRYQVVYDEHKARREKDLVCNLLKEGKIAEAARILGIEG